MAIHELHIYKALSASSELEKLFLCNLGTAGSSGPFQVARLGAKTLASFGVGSSKCRILRNSF